MTRIKAAVMLVVLGLGAAPGSDPRAKPDQGASHLADIGPAPAVELIDSAGRPFALSSLKGKAVLVSFIYTTCNGSCPATTSAMTQARRALKNAGLWGQRVEFVSISLDPTRDTPDVLTQYARAFGADTGSWHFLTGPPDEVSRVIKAWGMWAKVGPSGVLDHPSRIFLLDPHGHKREIYNLEFLKPDTVLQDVRAVLTEAESSGPKP